MREQLKDRMIRLYGFEHEMVITFFRLCETIPQIDGWDELLTGFVEYHEEHPVVVEEEE